MAHCYDLTGEKFGKLTARRIDRDRMNAEKELKGRWKTYWICECQCGNFKSISYHCLSTGATKSCGCIKRGRKKFEDQM